MNLDVDEPDDFAPPGLHAIWRDGILYVEGECDAHTAGYLQEIVDEHLLQSDVIRLDCSRLMFLGSSGIAVFVRIVRHGKHLIIVRPSPVVQRILGTADLLDFEGIEIED